jgi:hypothetical protein
VMNDAKELQEEWTFSLWNFSSNSTDSGAAIPSIFQLPVTGLLGAGAIGSAFGFILKSLNWRSHLDVIDFDSYEEPNEETTLILSPSDARKTPRKAEHFSKCMSSTELGLTPHVQKITGNSELIRQARPLFICAVDNAETRQQLDSVNAEVLINGAVGGNGDDAGWCLWSRHSAFDPALSSGYPENSATDENPASVPEEFSQDECSRKNYQGVALAIPFGALATSSLIAATCAHQAMDHRTSANKVTIDLFRKQQRIGVFNRKRI